jgi:hypothetical protein
MISIQLKGLFDLDVVNASNAFNDGVSALLRFETKLQPSRNAIVEHAWRPAFQDTHRGLIDSINGPVTIRFGIEGDILHRD